MRDCTRRNFLKTSLAGAGLLATAPASCAVRPGDRHRVVQRHGHRRAGKDGHQSVSPGSGHGFNGYNHSAHTRRGEEAFDRLLHHSLDEGVRFIDMADLYGSHPFVKEIVKGLPRDKFALLTKLWPRKEEWVTPSGGARQEIDRFRQELGVEQIDVCLIHCMTNDKWPTEYSRIRDELSELKDKKAIRAVGVSCHDFGALEVAAEHPWVDVIFARANHKGGEEYSCDASAEQVAAVLKSVRGEWQGDRRHEDFWGRQADQARGEGRVAQVRVHQRAGRCHYRGHAQPRRSRRYAAAHGTVGVNRPADQSAGVAGRAVDSRFDDGREHRAS